MAELDVSRLLSVQEAIDLIDRIQVSPRQVKLSLREAENLRLAQDIAADRDYPPFDKSLMDGYAVRAADLSLLPAMLKVVDEIAAGQWPKRAVEAGEAVAIMTGAPLPCGADGVVPIEEVERGPEQDAIRVLRADAPQRFIARRGSDCPAGQVVLRRGASLGPAQLAVAVSVGASEVQVFAAPRVAVLGTGDELVPIEATPGAGQIRESNNLMLCALLHRMGCVVSDLGTARDEMETLRAAVRNGLAHDALFITGGMSMGEYDFVPRVLLELGVELRVTKLRIKPGKPFVFGERRAGEASSSGTTYVFGLPGNPVSAFVCTVRLASRLLRRLAGGEASGGLRSATIETALAANGPREFYQPAVLNASTLKPLAWKGSADVYTLAIANALIVRPENDSARAAGMLVEFLEI